jgi:mono/diheme cytochrome c family protein
MPSRRTRWLPSMLAVAAVGLLAACAVRQGPTAAPAMPQLQRPPPKTGHPMWSIAAGIGLLLLLLAGAAVYEGQRQRSAERWAAALTGGDSHRGPALMIRNGCAGCHTIPGVPGAYGSAGPDLSGLADRAYIGGMLPNTADNLALWIRDARSVNPHTAMPSTRISDSDARDVAAYLYSLPR